MSKVRKSTDKIVAIFEELGIDVHDKEQEDTWTKDNLEYDLLSSDYIVEKCQNERYAQNLYAALCNNEFIKVEMWNILIDKKWSCSWRYAGGIIADIRKEGDYLDWYCSGIHEKDESDTNTRQYMSEGLVSDEIREDLLNIGWSVAQNNDGDEDA
jgi:hypothetical protein